MRRIIIKFKKIIHNLNEIAFRQVKKKNNEKQTHNDQFEKPNSLSTLRIFVWSSTGCIKITLFITLFIIYEFERETTKNQTQLQAFPTV